MFTEFGSTLQRRRSYDDYQIMIEYLQDDNVDPAMEDPVLLEKLNANKFNYRKREQEVIIFSQINSYNFGYLLLNSLKEIEKNCKFKHFHSLEL